MYEGKNYILKITRKCYIIAVYSERNNGELYLVVKDNSYTGKLRRINVNVLFMIQEDICISCLVFTGLFNYQKYFWPRLSFKSCKLV